MMKHWKLSPLRWGTRQKWQLLLVKTRCIYSHGPDSIQSWGTKILPAVHCSRKKKKKRERDHNMKKRKHLWTIGGNVNWYNHYGKQYGVPQKIKNTTTIWPSNPTAGYLSEKKNAYLTSHFHCNTIYNSQGVETIYVSINGWMDREDVVYMYIYIYIYTMEYYSAI